MVLVLRGALVKNASFFLGEEAKKADEAPPRSARSTRGRVGARDFR